MNKIFAFTLVTFLSVGIISPTLCSAASPNLVPNATLETVDATNSNQPAQWVSGGYGTNNRAFTYPVAGMNGGVAARLDITSYTDGDAKWYFADVPVTVGQEYVFEDNYISTVPTSIVVRYTDASGAQSYDTNFPAIPASPSTWGTAKITFTPKTGTVSVTVFHLLSSVGSLTVDNYLLNAVPGPIPFSQGFVSFTFDDNKKSQMDNAKPVLDAANIKSTFYVITHTSAGLTLPNAAFEIAGTSNPQLPEQWTTNVSGDNNAVFSYPVLGVSASKAAKVSATLFTSGAAAWQSKPVTVLPDSVYTYKDQYQSDVTTEIFGQAVLADNSVVDVDVVDGTGNSLGMSTSLPTSGTGWASAEVSFYIPSNAKTLTIYHRLISVGSLTIDNVSLGAANYMTADDIKSLQAEGNEIGAHTQTHPDLTTLSTTDAMGEILGARQDLTTNGITNVLTFNYPYGNENTAVEQDVQDAGFTSARTVAPGFNGTDTQHFALLSQSVNADTTATQVQSWIDSAIANKSWLILVFHDIVADTSTDPYGATPAMLQNTVDYLASKNVPVRTVSQGLALMTGSETPSPTTTSTTTPTTTPSIVTITKTISLKSGWNLITPMLQMVNTSTGQAENFTAESFGKMLGAQTVSQWLISSQQYNNHTVGNAANDFEIPNGMGVFVYMSETKEATITGVAITPATLTLSVGWNLLGWNGDTKITAQDLVARLGGALLIATYDGSTQLWRTYLTDLPIGNFDINPGDGVFVYKL